MAIVAIGIITAIISPLSLHITPNFYFTDNTKEFLNSPARDSSWVALHSHFQVLALPSFIPSPTDAPTIYFRHSKCSNSGLQPELLS